MMVLGVVISGCNSNDDPQGPVIDPPMYSSESLIVVNAGNYSYSNSSITRWNEEAGATNELFYKSNQFKLGDTAQSATVYNDKTWIVVNNSNIIFAVNSDTFKETGRVDEGISSPRYIHFVSDDKAYVTQMYTNKIAVVNPKTYKVTGYIDVPIAEGSASDGATEEMVQIGDYVYVNLWSYGNSIIKIDTTSDKITGQVRVGVQPYSIAKDYQDNLWALCDGGGWAENPAGYEEPSIMCIDTKTMSIKKTLRCPLGDSVSKLAMSGDKVKMYFILNHYNEDWTCTSQIVSIDTRKAELSYNTVVSADDKSFYSLTVSPLTGDIFAGDAIDYTQPGVVYRYSAEGKPLSSFTAGIIPTAYAWILK